VATACAREFRLASRPAGLGTRLRGRAAVDVARRIGAQSDWSFTSVGNERSQAEMRRLGLRFVRYFDHPADTCASLDR